MTSDAVRAAAASPDLNHRDPVYLGLVQDLKRSLRGMSDGYEPFLLGGAGTAGIEAMITSCVRTGPVLIITNGYYSDRLDAIFLVHGIPHTTLRFDWLEPWDLGMIERTLAKGRFEAVLGVHHETTTGRLNPIGELARIAAPYEAKVLVDASSSFGADELDFSGLHAVACGANKCLHGLPGLSFVLLEPSFAAQIRDYPRRTYYLSLQMYEGDQPPLTPPVPLMLAFSQALHEFESAGGQSARQAIYQSRAKTTREGLAKRGYEFSVPEEVASCTLTMATIPDGLTFDAWFERNYERGFVLYGCKGPLRDRFFQVGHMGEIPDGAIEEWLAGL